MEDQTRHDIRRLLKSFGIQADEAIMEFVSRYPGTTPLRVRITLQDMSEYSDTPPGQPLFMEIEGEIQRA